MNFTKRVFCVFLVSSLSTLALASEKAATVKKKAGETYDAAVDYSKEQKEEVQKTMETNINRMSDEIAELKQQASKATGRAKNEMNTQIANLETKQGELKRDLVKLKNSSGKAWGELKAGMSSAIDKMSDSFKKAKKEFSKSE